MIYTLGVHPETGLAHLTIHTAHDPRAELRREYADMLRAAECYEQSARQHDEQSDRLRKLASGARLQAQNLKEKANL